MIASQQSSSRQPRGLVKIGGTTFNRSDGSIDVASMSLNMPGWLEWSVENNTYRHADTFSVSFAVSALPDNRKEDWFAKQQEISVEIFAGFPADPEQYGTADLTSLIYGMADGVEFDPVARTIHLHGRDLTAKMIDTKITDVFLNRTASDIANLLAAKYDLTPKITPTTIKSGNSYELVNAHLHHGKSEWDLLAYMAQHEQFLAYMSGRELHLEPLPDQNADPYILQWQNDPFQLNGMSMKFERGLTLAKGAQVTVRSFNQKSGKAIKAVYPQNAASNAQQYNYRFAHLTSQMANQKAQALYAEITQHEVNFHAELLADNNLTTRNVIRVTGTGTAYDQLYYPASVSRSMSFDGGYKMQISAKNQSPQIQEAQQ